MGYVNVSSYKYRECLAAIVFMYISPRLPTCWQPRAKGHTECATDLGMRSLGVRINYPKLVFNLVHFDLTDSLGQESVVRLPW